jgi:mannose-1-phosphate guanylyltransferase
MTPLTRALYGRPLPKQFAELDGKGTFLQRTLDRIAPLVPSHRTAVVVASEWEALAREQLSSYAGLDLVLQPSNRGTGPGVLLPLAHVMARDPEATVVICPSDHHIRHPEVFLESLTDSVLVADREQGGMVLIGAGADYAATDLGWIVPEPNGRRVQRFVEKPAENIARALLEEGALWNTMVIVARARALWDCARRMLPTQTRALERYRATIGSAAQMATLADVYRDMVTADFSRDILESADELAVVPLINSGWSDCGTPERLFSCLRGTPELTNLMARLNRAERRVGGSVAAA